MYTVPWWSYPYLFFFFFLTTGQPNPEINPLSRAPSLCISSSWTNAASHASSSWHVQGHHFFPNTGSPLIFPILVNSILIHPITLADTWGSSSSPLFNLHFSHSTHHSRVVDLISSSSLKTILSSSFPMLLIWFSLSMTCWDFYNLWYSSYLKFPSPYNQVTAYLNIFVPALSFCWAVLPL